MQSAGWIGPGLWRHLVTSPGADRPMRRRVGVNASGKTMTFEGFNKFYDFVFIS